MNKFFKRVGVGGAVALAAVGSAHAAIDTTSITASITDAGTAAGVVAAAVLVVLVSIRAYKYIRTAL